MVSQTHRAGPISPMNTAPPNFDPGTALPTGLAEFLFELSGELAPRQRTLVAQRAQVLSRAHAGQLPNYLPPSAATSEDWRIALPDWSADQRNQMTGPADDAELVVKTLNSGAPGVMLDFGDSMFNTWPTPEPVTRIFDGELARLVDKLPPGAELAEGFRQARLASEAMIARGEFTPV